jgi:hypothetical protein
MGKMSSQKQVQKWTSAYRGCRAFWEGGRPKRKEKAAVKLTKKEESIKEAVAVLVRMGADFDTPEGLHRDYERALSQR